MYLCQQCFRNNLEKFSQSLCVIVHKASGDIFIEYVCSILETIWRHFPCLCVQYFRKHLETLSLYKCVVFQKPSGDILLCMFVVFQKPSGDIFLVYVCSFQKPSGDTFLQGCEFICGGFQKASGDVTDAYTPLVEMLSHLKKVSVL